MTDPATNRKLAKEYDFRTMKYLDEFSTSYMWPREQIINDESQFYVNPSKVTAEYVPFKLSNAGLSIIAMETPAELADYAVGISDKGREIGRDKMTPEQVAQYVKTQPYISGLLTSRDKGYSQLHGYWEMSAKLPSAKGAWPALWLLPTFSQWPAGIAVLSEIDIMEATGDVIKGIYSGSLHSNETGKMVHSTGNEFATGADLVKEYHRYGVSWEPDVIIWYFDGIEMIRRPTPKDMLAEPRHFLLNLAVGGWAGLPDPDDYPASFDIEYVRIYESNYVAPVPKVEQPDSIENTAKALEMTANFLREIRSIL